MAKLENFKQRHNLIGALDAAYERNKNENKMLSINKFHLDSMLQKNLAKIQREKTALSQQHIYALKQEKAKHKEEKDRFKLEKEKQTNRKRQLSSKYFELINVKHIDRSNSLLPCLIKSLKEQRLNSYRNIIDIAQRQNIKLVRKKSLKHIYNNSNKSQHFSSSSSSSSSFVNDSNLQSFTNFSNFSIDSAYLPNLGRANRKSSRLVDETAQASKYDINKFDLNEIKSIRRERLSAKQMNEIYDSKANILRIIRQYERGGSTNCSKLCRFKNLSALY